MSRRKALTIAVSVAGLSCLIFVLSLLSNPAPALSYASFTWKPGCHCGKPATTTAKATTKATTGKTSTKTKSPKRSTTTAGAHSAAGSSGGDGGSSSGSGGGGSGSLHAAGLAGADPAAAQTSSLPHYYFSPVAIVFLLVYGVSFALYRAKRLRVATHRKIWNVLLMATFLFCGITGLILGLGITRTPPLELPTWLLVWHVETGIAMCFISVFHIGWHLRYYLAIVRGKRQTARAEKVPALERGAGRERARRPQVTRPSPVRTETERRLVLKQPQAVLIDVSGTVQARAPRRAPASSQAARWLAEARRRRRGE